MTGGENPRPRLRHTARASDLSRLTRVGVSGAQGSVFTDQVSGYNQQDQIVGRTVTRRDANDNGTLANSVASAYGYGYDPNHGDALTSVTDGFTNANLYSYTYDQARNFTGNSALGSANNVNQYSALTYNSRGDVTDDGTYAYQYDAQDRLITVTPHDTSQLQVRYGYDSQGRRLWKTAYTNADGVWAPSYTRHYLWDGNNLVAELDGNNAILVGYTWGPLGLLAVTDYTATGGPKTYVAVEDLSRNVEAMVDPATGLPVASFHYDPYGKLLSATGPEKNLDGFEGQEEMSDKEDRNLGFSLHPSGQGDLRVVNYVTNSFMQRDAAGELAGGVNLYQLDGGDPVNKSDPSGQDWSMNHPSEYVPEFLTAELATPASIQAISLSDQFDLGIMNLDLSSDVVSAGIADAMVPSFPSASSFVPDFSCMSAALPRQDSYADDTDLPWLLIADVSLVDSAAARAKEDWGGLKAFCSHPLQAIGEMQDVVAAAYAQRILATASVTRNHSIDEAADSVLSPDMFLADQTGVNGAVQAWDARDIYGDLHGEQRAVRTLTAVSQLSATSAIVVSPLKIRLFGESAPVPKGAAVGGGTAATAAEPVAEPEGIIYRRTNPITGRKYIGQAKNLENYFARQATENNTLGVTHDFEILEYVDNDELTLDMAEESQIRLHGGPKVRGGVLENLKYQVNEVKYDIMGGTVPKPTR